MKEKEIIEISDLLNDLDGAVNILAHQLKESQKLIPGYHQEAIVHLHQMHFRLTECRAHLEVVKEDLKK